MFFEFSPRLFRATVLFFIVVLILFLIVGVPVSLPGLWGPYGGVI